MTHGKPFLSQAFTQSIFSRPDSGTNPLPATPPPGTIRLKVLAPMVEPDRELAMAGATQSLGSWEPQLAPALSDSEFPVWTIDVPQSELGTEYKFIVRSRADGTVCRWEEGFNRTLTPADGQERLSWRGPADVWHGSGVAIPVFSLRSTADCGIGDFLDLIPMADWAADSGMNFVQILPVNDTTATHTRGDSYPYSAISSFALNPIYLRVDAVGRPANPATCRKFAKLFGELNATEQEDYEAVCRAKEKYTRLVYKEQGQATLQSRDFNRFLNRNAHWLAPYAAFCLLRDEFHTADFRLWPAEVATYSPDTVADLLLDRREDMLYHYFVQYHLHLQLTQARSHAHSRHVALKGDIPIGISACSADAWQNPHLFHLDCQAGAPPDAFAALGQNWGFPTYNWPEMAKDGYLWWRQRLAKMAEYFDAYRIDHVLGFFRIWQIPAHCTHGLLGYFSPALPMSPDEMLQRHGFIFTPAYLMPAQPTHGFATQLQAAQAGHTDAENAFDNVLFIADPTQPGHYHPRIEGFRTSHYAALSDEQRHAFDRLYEDFYFHRHNDFWQQSAMSKLPTITSATGMLACAEDLGMIPACVAPTLQALQILTLEVQRMPKEYGREFGRPDSYPYLSIATTSTHDMPGIRGWWASLSTDRRMRYLTDCLGYSHDHASAEAEATDPSPALCTAIVRSHLHSASMLAILPLQDYLAESPSLRRADYATEQINNPADPHHYWGYRLHLPLEQIPPYSSQKFHN